MDLKKTGGQAFPTSDGQSAHAIAVGAISGIEDPAERDRVYTEVRGQAMQGMTLRDYFAAKAMQGICAHGDTWGCDIPEIAAKAYKMADAMLAERAK